MGVIVINRGSERINKDGHEDPVNNQGGFLVSFF
jgi:hypothetical protein